MNTYRVKIVLYTETVAYIHAKPPIMLSEFSENLNYADILWINLPHTSLWNSIQRVLS
jgi:hypothetical protein